MLMQYLNEIVQYVVIPIVGFVWLLDKRQQDHHTEIAVIKNQINSNKQNHERELAEIRTTTAQIFNKLNSIEEVLRK